MAGLTTKPIKDASGSNFDGRFYDDDTGIGPACFMIVGGGVIPGGSGVVTASVPRVTLVTDVPLPAGELHIGEVGGRLASVVTELTRPADTTPYTAGDVVSNSASSTTPITISNANRTTSKSSYIVGVRVMTDKKGVTPRLRVHLYAANSMTVSADNEPHRMLYADSVIYMGSVDLPPMHTPEDDTNSDSSFAQNYDFRIPFSLTTTTLYAVLQTLDDFTPNSGQKFRLIFLMDQN